MGKNRSLGHLGHSLCSKAKGLIKERENKQTQWCFTWHDYPHDWEERFIQLRGKLIGYIIGEEVCPRTDRPHLQGWIDFGRKRGRWSELKLPATIHWAAARGSPASNWEYCTKDDRAVVWGTGELARPKPAYQIFIELSPWQERLSNILKQEPSHRTVYWVWEPNGKAGKTLFQKWWCCQHNQYFPFFLEHRVLFILVAAISGSNGSRWVTQGGNTIPPGLPCF